MGCYKRQIYDRWLTLAFCTLTVVLLLIACSAVEMKRPIEQPTPSELELQPTAEGRSSTMCGDTISAEDLAELTGTLADVVQRIGSLEELEDWLRSQHCVESVRTADYLIKTEPPQNELLVTFKMDDSSTVTKVIDIILYRDQTLGLGEVHEP
jgi:hypothetical protein